MLPDEEVDIVMRRDRAQLLPRNQCVGDRLLDEQVHAVTCEVRADRRLYLAMYWIIGAAKGKKGRPMHQRLADELLAASNGEGDAVKKREGVHKMAEANKAFAHFAW